MAWSTPLTAVANAALTAAQWNASVRDNLNASPNGLASAGGQIFVATAANTLAARTPAQATVDTSQTTASTTFTDLATSGPAVTCTTGTRAIVFLHCHGGNNTSAYGWGMGYAVSGATTAAASDAETIGYVGGGAGNNFSTFCSGVFFPSLTAGSNTFTAKYEAANGGTAAFSYRKILVIPL